MGFGAMTEDEKIEALTRARAGRAAKNAARKASTLRRDFLDADLWLELASERGLRLPPWGEPATMSNMRTWLHRTGWSQGQFEEWAGCRLVEFLIKNSDWPARALAGIILEQQKEQACSITTE